MATGRLEKGGSGGGGGALVPLDDRALDLEVGQANRRLPALGRLEDEVVEGLGNLGVLSDICVRKVMGHGIWQTTRVAVSGVWAGRRDVCSRRQSSRCSE